jgi:hypothetical protein
MILEKCVPRIIRSRRLFGKIVMPEGFKVNVAKRDVTISFMELSGCS